MPLRILIAIRNPYSQELLDRLLSACGFELLFDSDDEQFSQHVRTFWPDVVLFADSTFTPKQQTIAALRERSKQKDLSIIITNSAQSHSIPLKAVP